MIELIVFKSTTTFHKLLSIYFTFGKNLFIFIKCSLSPEYQNGINMHGECKWKNRNESGRSFNAKVKQKSDLRIMRIRINGRMHLMQINSADFFGIFQSINGVAQFSNGFASHDCITVCNHQNETKPSTMFSINA